MIVDALRVLEFDDSMCKSRVLHAEDMINNMQKEYLAKHSQRLCAKQCNPHSALVYVDFINNIEKMADHLVNVAYASSHDFAQANL